MTSLCPKCDSRIFVCPSQLRYSVITQIPSWGPSPVLPFLLTSPFLLLILSGDLRKENSTKITQTRYFRASSGAFQACRGRRFMNARRAGASLMLISIHPATPSATSPILLCSKPAAGVPGEQAFTVTAASSCPQQHPNPAGRPWHPKSLCVHSALAFLPSGCQDLG